MNDYVLIQLENESTKSFYNSQLSFQNVCFKKLREVYRTKFLTQWSVEVAWIFHRIIKSSMKPGCHLVLPSAQAGWPWDSCPELLNISKDGESTTCLGNLYSCSATLRVKKCFLMFSRNLLWFSLCPLPWSQKFQVKNWKK